MNSMISIVKVSEDDFQMLSEIGKLSFVESHSHSAAPDVIDNYSKQKFSEDAIRFELKDPANIFHFIFYNNKPAGYSKIIFNSQLPEIKEKNVTKLERLYLLKEFYGLRLGQKLLQFNLDISKENEQSAMWLYTWKENHRAIKFYLNNGFKIIGSYDFKLSESHFNPNHLMFLKY